MAPPPFLHTLVGRAYGLEAWKFPCLLYGVSSGAYCGARALRWRSTAALQRRDGASPADGAGRVGPTFNRCQIRPGSWACQGPSAGGAPKPEKLTAARRKDPLRRRLKKINLRISSSHRINRRHAFVALKNPEADCQEAQRRGQCAPSKVARLPAPAQGRRERLEAAEAGRGEGQKGTAHWYVSAVSKADPGTHSWQSTAWHSSRRSSRKWTTRPSMSPPHRSLWKSECVFVVDHFQTQLMLVRFIGQYDEEYDSLKKARRPGRPGSAREDLLKMKIAALRTEFKNGFGMTPSRSALTASRR